MAAGWRLAVLLLGALIACSAPTRAVVLATTTSMAGTGLLDHLLPAFESATGIAVRVHPVGSGRALRMLADGLADVAITHAPALEAEALAARPGWTYRKLLYNDFLIAGPEADPAGVRAATGAAEAFRRLATKAPRWISRGDRSGTHERENELWKAAGVRPPDDRFMTTGQGMSGTLRVASELDAYTLVDRGSFLQLASRIRSRELYSGDPALLNTYAIIARADEGDTRAFVDWLGSGAGRARLAELISAGTVHGFHMWPAGRADRSPADVPR